MKRIYMILVAVIFIVYGCATPKLTEVKDTMVLQGPPIIETPAPKPEPIIKEEIPQAKDRFSLSVRDADVRDVFLLLSKDSGINIIADMDVKGKISIDFTNLDLNSALYAITRQLGYTFRMDKGFVRVCKPQMETRSFRINYITTRRTSSSTMSAAITGGGSSSGITGYTSNTNINVSNPSGSSSTEGTSSTASLGQGNVNVTTSGTTDFWKEVTRGLDVIIFGDSKGAYGSDSSYSRGDDKTGKKLAVSELAGIIHVTDYSDNMEKIEDFLNDVEKAVRKQVMIQAHILEVSLNDDYKFGIDWALLMGKGKGTNNELFNISQDLTVTPHTGVFNINVTGKKITALLDAMKGQGQVNVLSSPKISTMNNQRAVIKLTTKEVSWLTNSYLTSDGTIYYYANPQIDEVGLFLDVTPQIDDNGIITMQIHPSISEKTKDSFSPDGKSSKSVIDARELDTMIKTRNGQTIVIAGLITDKLNDSIKKVPWLGDIPVLGHIFKQTIQTKSKSELVILMTPYVLNDQSVEDIRKEHEERLRKAGRTFEPVPALIQ